MLLLVSVTSEEGGKIHGDYQTDCHRPPNPGMSKNESFNEEKCFRKTEGSLLSQVRKDAHLYNTIRKCVALADEQKGSAHSQLGAPVACPVSRAYFSVGYTAGCSQDIEGKNKTAQRAEADEKKERG